MIIDIINSNDYQMIVQDQIYDTIDYLLAHNQEFSITANLKSIVFEPELPKPIIDTFMHFTMFSLVNYTYESIELTPEQISFEAGFGAENFSSVVTIPLGGIFQIVIDESILYLNPTATVDERFELEENILAAQEEKSMNIFKRNNKNLFK